MSGSGSVVVGYDDSRTAQKALDWAAAHCARTGSRLTVLHAADRSGSNGAGSGGEPGRDESRSVAEAGADQALLSFPGLSVTPTAVAQPPALALVEASREADLVVLGTQGRAGFTSAARTSVARSVAEQALSPAVVVRGTHVGAPGPRGPVAVGVDGSPGADAAVRFAAGVAAATGAPLKVICVWRPTSEARWETTYWPGAHPDRDVGNSVQRTAEETARRAVDTAIGCQPGLLADWAVVSGAVGPMLAVQTRRAGLLVIGSHSTAGFAGPRLGDVGRVLLLDAPCPVAVVHARADDG